MCSRSCSGAGTPTACLRFYLSGLIAAVLPMGTTSWLSGVIEAMMALVMRLGYLLLFLLMALLSILLWPLRFLFSRREQPPAQQLPMMEIPTQAEAASRLPDWLGGAVLWVVVALLVVYFGLTYLGAHGLLKGKPLQWLTRLRFWWRARWATASAAFLTAANALGKRLQVSRLSRAGGPQAHAVRVSALTPDERVRYFYLRMVGRAAEHGLPRPPHQTPSELTRQLESQWPDAEPDVDTLTEAFVANAL